MPPMQRTSGVLLHPSSLWGRFGIGDLGPAASEWIQFLRETRTGLWQILPLGPTGYGDSPYQTFSSFAGNTFLLSPTRLLRDGFLIPDDLEDIPEFPTDRVDFGPVIRWKDDLLDTAHRHYAAGDAASWRPEVTKWAATQPWLDDYALFRALKDDHDGEPWTTWDKPVRLRDDDALAEARTRLADDMERHVLGQFLFARQWTEVKQEAHDAGVRIVGDLPIFVAADSADVWANQELFHLDDEGRPFVVAGVPPDYFSTTGQLWGNPLYRWDRHLETGFAWWKSRLRSVLDAVDIVRIDHFRAFADYWEIPADAPTAETGRWRYGPGDAFFAAIRDEFGELPIIAEDLGELHDIVIELRDRWNLPGMSVLQFAFDGEPDNDFLPHRYREHSVAYTGTHDNDTTVGWWESASATEKEMARSYLGTDGSDIAAAMVWAVWASRAEIAVAPVQDFLRLGTEARMNTPGEPAGNWSWRLQRDQLSDQLASEIRSLNEAAHRT